MRDYSKKREGAGERGEAKVFEWADPLGRERRWRKSRDSHNRPFPSSLSPPSHHQQTINSRWQFPQATDEPKLQATATETPEVSTHNFQGTWRSKLCIPPWERAAKAVSFFCCWKANTFPPFPSGFDPSPQTKKGGAPLSLSEERGGASK